MADLNAPLSAEVRRLVESDYPSLKRLVNELVDEHTDYEHIITFLDESPSAIHRTFAHQLRVTFEKVLRQRLAHAENELGKDRFRLYAALLDMYNVDNCPEQLAGIITINYDNYIEEAANAASQTPIDYGVPVNARPPQGQALRLLKLHGSFNWRDVWPIQKLDPSADPNFDAFDTLWIPPGIQKDKARYPFNTLWGNARELLDCDLLRIIGCRLSASDWDLISLLFATRHAHAERPPYVIEIIDSPERAAQVQRDFPYLQARSLLESETLGIGDQLVGEFLGAGPPKRYDALSEGELARVNREAAKPKNWFFLWMTQMAEAFRSHPSIGPLNPDGEFARLLEN